MKKIFIIVLVNITISSLAYAVEESKKFGKYDSFMYKNGNTEKQTTFFSPSDKIFIEAKLFELEKGDYVFKVHWYNPSGKLQETATHIHTLKEKTLYNVRFWLALKKKKLLSGGLSVFEYNERFYGYWEVVVFVNGLKLVTKEFEVE